VCADAAEFSDVDRFTHVYLVDPFALKIVTRVYENLVTSVRRSPCPITVSCKYPEGGVYECLPPARRFQLLAKSESKFSRPFYVFSLRV